MRNSRNTDVVVIGGGQAGLAMSHCLTTRSIDHVVLERGEIANSWTTERWDSLRLLTPNWLSRLPGYAYRADDPDGFMTAGEVANHLAAYREAFDAPVETGTEVAAVAPSAHGWTVETGHDLSAARGVVLATGACSDPHVPAIAADLPDHLHHVTPIAYRRPDQLGDGPVLVVGASASGLQIADELARAGRHVTLAVGEHVRLPRTYRGMDIHWWMDQVGVLGERIGDVDDVQRARRTPSLQLIGSPDRRDLDLNAVAAVGVDVRGRLAGVRGTIAQFSGSLANMCALADLKQRRLLDRIDEHATSNGLTDEIDAPHRPAPTLTANAGLELDLSDHGTVIWATGFRPRYPWLDTSLLDGRGRLVHDAGVLPAPGGYVLGLPFMRRRSSSFIDGVGRDARGAHRTPRLAPRAVGGDALRRAARRSVLIRGGRGVEPDMSASALRAASAMSSR